VVEVVLTNPPMIYMFRTLNRSHSKTLGSKLFADNTLEPYCILTSVYIGIGYQSHRKEVNLELQGRNKKAPTGMLEPSKPITAANYDGARNRVHT
jgi:hypothetical protein